METLGKSFIIVIEPFNFNIKRCRVLYNNFGFVVSSQSQFFRDLMFKLCKKCNNIRANHFGPHILTDIRRNMKILRKKGIKTEVETLKLVSTCFDIAYYTGVTHDLDTHLQSFSTIVGTTFHYFLYVGTKAYNSLGILDEIRKKVEMSKNEVNSGSYFEIISIKN